MLGYVRCGTLLVPAVATLAVSLAFVNSQPIDIRWRFIGLLSPQQRSLECGRSLHKNVVFRIEAPTSQVDRIIRSYYVRSRNFVSRFVFNFMDTRLGDGHRRLESLTSIPQIG